MTNKSYNNFILISFLFNKYTFLVFSALFINSIYAIDSHFLKTTAIENDHKSTEQFTKTPDNEIGAYGSSKINQLRKHANIHGAKNLTVNDKRFKHLPYLKNDNLYKVPSICHKCTRSSASPLTHQGNLLNAQHNAKLSTDKKLEEHRFRNLRRKEAISRVKREPTVNYIVSNI